MSLENFIVLRNCSTCFGHCWTYNLNYLQSGCARVTETLEVPSSFAWRTVVLAPRFLNLGTGQKWLVGQLMSRSLCPQTKSHRCAHLKWIGSKPMLKLEKRFLSPLVISLWKSVAHDINCRPTGYWRHEPARIFDYVTVGLQAGRSEVRIPKGERFFSLLRNV
jgi:hypothetical protein